MTASRCWAARDASVGYNNVFEWFLSYDFLSFDDLRSLLGFVKRLASVLDLGCGTSIVVRAGRVAASRFAPLTSRRGRWDGAGAICEDHV